MRTNTVKLLSLAITIIGMLDFDALSKPVPRYRTSLTSELAQFTPGHLKVH